METTFTVNKANVYTEVAKTTSYAGIKKAPGGTMYETIFTTDDDRLMLERFWHEAANTLTELFKPFLVSVTSTAPSHGIDLSENYTVVLKLSVAYDSLLNDSVQSSMFSFFVTTIISKWFTLADKDESEAYGLQAVGFLDDIKSKIYYKKKPTRITQSDV